MKVKDIFEIINSFAPVESALSFDNAGILVGDPSGEVKTALVCLDCTPAAVKKAKNEGAELIITHHPVIFSPLKKVVAEKGNVVYDCIKNGIAVISMHTNLDTAKGGVNDCLARALNLKNISPITDEEEFSFRKGELEKEMSAEGLARYVKSILGGVIRFTDGGTPVKSVAVCGGSGAGSLNIAMENADAFITADIKHNVFIEAAARGYTLLDAGHFHTENVVVEPLSKWLFEKSKTVKFIPFKGNEIKTI